MREVINIAFLKRNIRLNDNRIIEMAAGYEQPLLLLYVFDDRDLLNARQKQFVLQLLNGINESLNTCQSSVLVKEGDTVAIMKVLMKMYTIENLFVDEAYDKDQIVLQEQLKEVCVFNHTNFHQVKDHLIFAPGEILKNDNTPYTVFTPFKKKWLQKFSNSLLYQAKKEPDSFYKCDFIFPDKLQIIKDQAFLKVKDFRIDKLSKYELTRDYPAEEGGSYLGPHLRFGSVSIRDVVRSAYSDSEVFLSELIWREFFMHIMYFFPESKNICFKKKYEFIHWRNNENEFDLWCKGQTGIPIVDAGMRELNSTGYMHNRVRMITASFLCKHLLIDWRWGESYFASKLLDYEVSSNVGNWQWVAGTGCDAAPYFRIFNPITQQKKFDRDFLYIRKWVNEFDCSGYKPSIVDLKIARERALKAYKKGINRLG